MAATRRVAASLLTAMLTAAAGAQQAPAANRAVLVARLDSLTRDFLAVAPAAGATVAVVRGNDTLLLAGFGERDREAHLAADRATVYRIGSITKQFTAAAVMQLVDAKRISLADSLGKLLPQYPQWSTVTLRELLNHTSGIPSYTAKKEWAAHWTEDLSPAAIVDFVAKDKMDFAPGTKWSYDNTGYMLLGMILEKVSGAQYAEYLNAKFFKPLRMKNAAYCPSRPTDPSYAKGYDKTPAGIAPTAYLSMTHPWAAGALCMSVPDFLLWQTALTSGRVVPTGTYVRMSTADALSDGTPITYGFALFPAHLGTHVLIHHGGDVNGFSAQQLWLPEDSLRVIVFTNTLGSNPDALAVNLASAALGLPLRPMPKPLKAVALAAADRAKYEGIYDLALPGNAKFPLHVFIDGDGLAAQAEGPGQGKFPLIYLGGDVFGTAIDPTIRITIAFANGVANTATLLQRGNTLTGVRRP
jgi:CubicO group peptidase (beta-lactamase class C family)